MTTHSGIKEDIQSLEPSSPYVVLYIIDATEQGDTIYYVTPNTLSGNPTVDFNGVTYYSIPMEAEGFQYNNEGKPPRPKLRVANVNTTFLAGVVTFNDLVGAKVSRIRTFKKYLDDEAEEDSTAEFPRDIYYIEQKTRQNANFIEWELCAPFDIEGVVLPKGQALPWCAHRYGIGGENTTCPYDGSNGYFDENGQATTSGNDVCAKKIFDCRLRYPENDDILPFKGFPAITQLGYSYRR